MVGSMKTKTLLTTTAATLALLLAACGGGSDDDATAASGGDATEQSSGSDTGSDDAGSDDSGSDDGGSVEVPSPDGAITIADFMANGGPDDVEDFSELQIALGVVGTDADGYIAGTDLVVTVDAEQDAQFLCIAADTSNLDTYRIIPVDADGNAIDCS
jgi:hypothetical protein